MDVEANSICLTIGSLSTSSSVVFLEPLREGSLLRSLLLWWKYKETVDVNGTWGLASVVDVGKHCYHF